MPMTRAAGEVTIHLSSDDFDLLLLALGMAAGSAHGEGNTPMFYSLMRPHFRPYEIPEEFRR